MTTSYVAITKDDRRAGREATRLRYETSLLGLAAIVAPPLVLVSFLFVGFIAGIGGRVLTAALEAGVPLSVGLTAASLLASETALELHVSSPGGFRSAALRRLGLLVAWAAVLSLLATVAGRVTGLLAQWPGPADPLHDVLLSLAPLSAFAVWGCLLGVALRSRGAAAAVLTAFWIAGFAFKDWFLSSDPMRAWFPFLVTFVPNSSDQLANRLALLAIAAAGLVIVAAWLGRAEWLLSSEDR
jgi:hypothetical protein